MALLLPFPRRGTETRSYSANSAPFWVYTHNNGLWSAIAKVAAGGSEIPAGPQAVAISADGSTIISGDSSDGTAGSATVFVRVNGSWSAQGPKLVGSGSVAAAIGGARQGASVALSADGKTALVGGFGDGIGQMGAVWVFTRSNGVWVQQGEKLTGSGTTSYPTWQGQSVALAADGNTAAFGGVGDDHGSGALWVFTRSNGVWKQDGPKLSGSDSGPGNLGLSVAISGDGQTIMAGGWSGSGGAALVFVKINGVWVQQGSQLIPTDASGPYPHGGGAVSVALSQDGNTACLGESGDSSGVGAVWIFTRVNGVWMQQGHKLVGTGAVNGSPSGDGALQGGSVAISGDGNTVFEGGEYDTFPRGAAWVFVKPVVQVTLSAAAASAPYGSPVTLTAVLNPNNAGLNPMPAPTGSVQFLDGLTVLGSVGLSGSKTSFTVQTLSPGTHLLSAVYSGDGEWFGSTSAPASLTVGPEPTATTLALVADGSTVALSASVSPASSGNKLSIQYLDQQTNSLIGGVLLAGGNSASLLLNPAMAAAASGHSIVAAFSGNDLFASSTSAPLLIPAAVNAGGAGSPNLAPGELVSFFGANLATVTASASTQPLPTNLGGVSISVIDGGGTAHPAAISYVSPAQINFLVPTETPIGNAALVVAGANGTQAIPVTIATVAPGIFSSTLDGKTLAAAQILRVSPDGTQTLEEVAPSIDLGAGTVYLLLYGTGLRNRSALSSVVCSIGTFELPVDYAGAQGDYPGLDQVNVLLPGAGSRAVERLFDR